MGNVKFHLNNFIRKCPFYVSSIFKTLGALEPSHEYIFKFECTDVWMILFDVCYRVFNQHKLTRDQWEERIKNWYAEHRGMLRYNTFASTVIP